MRIGLFIDTFNLGGAETMVFELAALLKKVGHQPVLFHFGSEYVVKFCTSHGIQHSVMPNHKEYKKTLLLPLFALKTIRYLKSFQLDCMHSHLFGPIVAMGLTCYLAGIKHVGTLHDVYTIEEKPSRIRLLKLATLLKTRLIAVSTPMYAFYQTIGGFTPSKLVHIPNFAPDVSLEPNSNNISLKQEHNISEETFCVLGVGRLVELKQFTHLVQAAALIKAPVHIFIAGDGPEMANLKQQIDELQLTTHVTLLGERGDVQWLLSQVDAFSLVSRTEGLSRSVLEALAAGLPVIATNVGGNSDLVFPEENGYLVESGDINGIAESITDLALNNAKKTKMGLKSLELAKSKFSETEFVKAHVSIYQKQAV